MLFGGYDLNWAGADPGPRCCIHGDRLDFFSSLGVHEPRQDGRRNAQALHRWLLLRGTVNCPALLRHTDG